MSPAAGADVPRVLVVEDEAVMAEVLRDNLEAEGYAVEVAPDGLQGEAAWRRGDVALVVLDVMLPGRDGFAICERRRAAGDATPVLFLSARGEAEDRVRGLAAGGDDYLTKPFHLPEFLLRVEALLRRGAPRGHAHRLQVAGCDVDLRAWTLTRPDGKLEHLGERDRMVDVGRGLRVLAPLVAMLVRGEGQRPEQQREILLRLAFHSNVF